MKLLKINPYELSNLNNSIDSIISLFSDLSQYQDIFEKLDIDDYNIQLLESFIQHINETFEVDSLSKINFCNKEEPINFLKNKDKYETIYELEDCINLGENFMDHLVDKCTKIIENCGEKRFMKKDNSNLLQLKK